MALKLAAVAVCGTLALSPARASSPEAIRVDPSTGHYVDSHGRTRLFHGVNVVYKIPPWYPPSDRFTPTDSLDLTTMQNLHEWGFNVVRLGVMWPGVEPTLGNIDHGYLAAIDRLTQGLAKHGVYTIADLHQDVGSRRFCGEGIPEHYVDKLLRDRGSRLAKARPFPEPSSPASELRLNESGFPLLEDCLKRQFALYYDTEKVAALWEELYTPGTELNRGFLRFWSAVASAFKGAPHILAYELVNEPSGVCIGRKCRGGVWDYPTEVIGSSVEAQYLTPLYRAAAREIRSAGAAQPILYAPTVLPKVGSSLFPELVLGNDTQQGLAYHVYCQPGDGNSTVAGLICAAAQAAFTHSYYPYLERNRGLGGFMTEFGAVGGNEGELEHLNWLMKTADEHFQSWAYWQLKLYQDFTTANAAESLYDAQGRLNVPKLKALSRTYAPAIAGAPLRMSFDPATAAFELDFNASVAGAPTEIYLNEDLSYQHGYTVEVAPPGCMQTSKPEKNRIHLTLEDQSCLNHVVKVQVRASNSALFTV
mmetsp:Transcript_6483/g.19660  ORF Transcript_6483/g.19660 Transcript_6483/m.19660 type:complete len:534 (-) Transcript_6483:205-1806(-)